MIESGRPNYDDVPAAVQDEGPTYGTVAEGIIDTLLDREIPNVTRRATAEALFEKWGGEDRLWDTLGPVIDEIEDSAAAS